MRAENSMCQTAQKPQITISGLCLAYCWLYYGLKSETNRGAQENSRRNSMCQTVNKP